MKEELDSLIQNDTWELVSLPADKQALTSKCVFKAKPMIGKTQLCLKVSLVARGLEQREGIDYVETFAPVVSWSTWRLVIALAVASGWDIHHMDVVTAFLNGKLDKVIYMR